MIGFRLAGGLLLAAATGAAGMAVAQNAAGPRAAATPQAGAAAHAAAAASANADDPQTVALFEKTCSGCHEISQATGQQHDQKGWDEVVQQMVGFGAQLSPEDQARLTRYLASKYGPPAAK